jgi:hypothetical protein
MEHQFEKVFEADGTPFGATWAAEKWLRENGYSYGPSCIGCPQAIIKGDISIAKWRNLTSDEKRTVDGTLQAARDQRAVITLKATPWRNLSTSETTSNPK